MTFAVFFALLAMLIAFSVSAADDKIMRRHRIIDAAGAVEETEADDQISGGLRLVDMEDEEEQGREFSLYTMVEDRDCQGREGTDSEKHQGTQHNYKIQHVDLGDEEEQGQEFSMQMDVEALHDQGREDTDSEKHQGTQHNYKIHHANLGDAEEQEQEFSMQAVEAGDDQRREDTDSEKHQGTQHIHTYVHHAKSDPGRHYTSQPDQVHEGTNSENHQRAQREPDDVPQEWAQDPIDHRRTQGQTDAEKEANLIKQIQDQKHISTEAAGKLELAQAQLEALQRAEREASKKAIR